jgi:hypothetical protein
LDKKERKVFKLLSENRVSEWMNEWS